MTSYLALLGSTPDLSFAELQTMAGENVLRAAPNLAQLELADDQSARDLLSQLGGTIKFFRQLSLETETNKEAVYERAVAVLAERATQLNNAIDFAISEIGRDHLGVLEASEIKQALKQQGFKVRYVEGSRKGLNAASLKSNTKMQELAIIQTANGVYYGFTVAVQDVDDWALRDRQKPFAQHKRGLLPPKVARMMVNLALGSHPAPSSVVLDPFCGSGTIMFEALLRGVNTIGGDIEAEAADGTKENLQWFRQEYQVTAGHEARVFMADATQLSLPTSSVTHVVTEPFLGKQTPRPEQLPNMFRGLERMYLGAFKHWRSFLAPQAQLVIIFPVVDLNDGVRTHHYSLEALIDKLAEFGYTTTSEPILYARPGAIVQRAIHRFTYVTR